ncbi:hypothetical protein K443DRAFT_483069 [Laccaria amethystina LaAM-08-1]|uniref:Uncharacterized protein n=1 Tax=Laccaria amethystina LaAM-08-1 TaxID=1095629 RepID=A0A0C9WTC2_9AGAR|nr:hypothetical protein K443DRAFT_483069 [Laccaria amethystina LaAM-08-1]
MPRPVDRASNESHRLPPCHFQWPVHDTTPNHPKPRPMICRTPGILLTSLRTATGALLARAHRCSFEDFVGVAAG